MVPFASFVCQTAALHTAAAPAVSAAAKPYLSYRNDTIIVIFCAANANKDNTNGALASSNSPLENSGLN